jgi:DDE superfamily endonuclease
MKHEIYNVKVCFNKEKLVLCTCDCKAGGEKEEKIVCVHVLPVLYQLTLLLFDGLADSIIVALAHHWKRMLPKVFSDEILNEIKQNIITLIAASQEILPIECNNMTIEEILRKFNVGTEKSKMPPPAPRNSETLGPLRDEDLRSIHKRASDIINKKTNNDNVRQQQQQNIENNNNNEHITTSSYQNIIKAIVALHKILPKADAKYLESFIGYRILEIRATPLTYNNAGNIIKYKKEIKQLISLSNNDERVPPPPKISIKERKEQHVSEEDSNSNDDDDIVELVDENLPTPVVIKEKSSSDDDEYINEATTKVAVVRHRRTCCACEVTTANDPDATFSKVPFSVQKPINIKSTDYVRQTSCSRDIRRREYLRRLGLNVTDKRKHLWFCSNHRMELAIIKYTWDKANGDKKESSEEMLVPVDPNEPPSRTRLQQSSRRDPPTPKRRRFLVNSNEKVAEQAQTNKKQSVSRRHCNFVNCKTRGTNNGIRYCRVPKAPTLKTVPTDDKDRREKDLMTFQVNKYFRNQCMRRIGKRINDPTKDIRICNKHPIEMIVKEIDWLDDNQTNQKVKIKMYIPTGEGVAITSSSRGNNDIAASSQQPVRENRGLAKDRWLNRILQEVDTSNNECILLSQMLEVQEGNIDIINPVVARSAGLSFNEVHERIRVEIIKDEDELKMEKDKRVKVRFNDLTDVYVKTITGFPSAACMMAFIMVVTFGNIQQIEQTTTHLTWLEEWFIYYEVVWCKHSTRWVDLAIRYNVSSKTVRNIFINKLTIHINARAAWPIFVTCEEDIKVRKHKWNIHYANKRVILWDNTSVPFTYKPSASDIQRNTYSMYYAGNVAKGGVFIQPCGWMGTHHLWVGAVSDSEYMERSGVLDIHTRYVTEYDTEYTYLPFTLILDKGYRINEVAWKNGKQLVLQPSFARSDRKFTSRETIRNSGISSDRSCNERAVRLSKICGYIRTGLRQNESAIRLDDVWLSWSFQVNFFYKPVL